MPAGKTYVKIASQTSSSAFGAVTFSNLPQNYTDLYLVLSVRANATPSSFGTGIRFNSDTGSNYSRTVVYGYGSVGNASDTSATRIFVSSGTNTASQFNVIRLNLMNYSNGSVYKTVIGRNDDKADVSSMFSALWSSNNPITSITITPFDDNATGFAAGTTLTIYGIECAKNPKAEGGNISTDGTYWYHTFKTSGIFTPRQSLTANVLVVAGGAGGGGAYNVSGTMGGGGGGAGGLLEHTSQSLTTQTYTVTVGAGGTAGGYANQGGANPGSSGGAGNNSQFGSLTAATGGGGGANRFYAPGNGGSGGGGASDNGFTYGTGTSGQGSNGGEAYGSGTSRAGAGGGGKAAAGGRPSGTTGGAGGNGSSSYSSWGAATGTGQNFGGTYYYAGGGAGGGGSGGSGGSGGLGGGGNGANAASNGSNGTANTGGGAGGGEGSETNSGTTGNGGVGGSGIVIVRYAV